MGAKRLLSKSELDRLYGHGWEEEGAYTCFPQAEELSVPEERDVHARESAPPLKGDGAFSFQLVLPGFPPPNPALQQLADAQRAMVESFERYEALRGGVCLFNLPALVRRQAE